MTDINRAVCKLHEDVQYRIPRTPLRSVIHGNGAYFKFEPDTLRRALLYEKYEGILADMLAYSAKSAGIVVGKFRIYVKFPTDTAHPCATHATIAIKGMSGLRPL